MLLALAIVLAIALALGLGLGLGLPSLRSTDAPSSSPTTLAPTASPTPAPTAAPTIVLYLARAAYNGNMGNRAATSAICAANWTGTPCRRAVAVLSYPGDGIDQLATTYDFNPSSPVYGYAFNATTQRLYATNVQVATSWTNFVSIDPLSNLYTAVVAEGLSPSGWWSGGFDGTDANHCSSFTSSSPAVFGTRGRFSSTSFATLFTSSPVACNQQNQLLCLCEEAPVTRGPTPAPSLVPTTMPTTNSPSASPTVSASRDVVIIYDSGNATTGNIGNRATSSALCGAAAVAQSLNCSTSLALLDYSGGDEIFNFADIYLFDSASPVVSKSGVYIADTWGNFANGGPLKRSLSEAGVISTNFRYGEAGGFTVNCLDFSSASAGQNSRLADVNSKVNVWSGLISATCDVVSPVVCACIERADTNTPTTARPTTNSPSRTPTTLAPTSEPPVVLFSDNVVTLGTLGDRMTTTARCAAAATAQSRTCSQTPALISYSPSDSISNMPSTFSFSAAAPVFGPSLQITSSWSNLGTTLINTFFAAGVVNVEDAIWTGGYDTGSANCNNWSSGSMPDEAMAGVSWATNTQSFNFGTFYCEASFRMVCACVP